jgi:NAD(P)-dependent dehydrogenase (short-subunit alcohol dehydrogenase family)
MIINCEQAIALAFAKADAARIVIASRSVEKLKVTKQDLVKVNPNVDILVLVTDITSEESVGNLEENARSTFGTADVLINAAGLWLSTDTVEKSSPKQWWADFVRYPHLNFRNTWPTALSD